MRHDAALFALRHRRQQRPHADARRAQRVHLVNLDERIQLAAAFQNLRHLIGRHGVQPAAEGVELNQLQIIPLADKLRRHIQAGMVHPLVAHAQGMLAMEGRGDAVLGQHRQTIGGNQLRHTVVNFRVNVIRATRQHDALPMVFLHPL